MSKDYRGFSDALWARYGDVLDKRDRSIVAKHCQHPTDQRYPFEWGFEVKEQQSESPQPGRTAEGSA